MSSSNSVREPRHVEPMLAVRLLPLSMEALSRELLSSLSVAESLRRFGAASHWLSMCDRELETIRFVLLSRERGATSAAVRKVAELLSNPVLVPEVSKISVSKRKDVR